MADYNAYIAGTGSYLPEKVLTNADLEKMVDTSNEWIMTRTGIKERRIAKKTEATSDLASIAAKRALKDANISPNEIDAIIVGTVTPDMFFPSTACIVQKNIGAKNAFAFDISAACSSFLYGLSIAKNFIENGSYKNILVISADSLSKVTDWTDRSTCVLFGDGAGACVVQRSETLQGIFSIYLGSDGHHEDLLYIPGCGSRNPASPEVLEKKLQYIRMAGGEVFKLAVGSMIKAAKKALELSDLTPNDLSLLIPHQANMRIIEATYKRLKLPKEKVFINIEKYGNMSGATVAVALDQAVKSARVKKGDYISLVAFGAGLTWASGVIKWGK